MSYVPRAHAWHRSINTPIDLHMGVMERLFEANILHLGRTGLISPSQFFALHLGLSKAALAYSFVN